MEKEKTGFQKLEEYFKGLDRNNILVGNNRRLYVNMCWIFTELFDKTVVKKAISNILKKTNPTYEARVRKARKTPEDINDIDVINNPDRMILQFTGADNWTKINVTDTVKDTDAGGIKTIALEELEKEIVKVLEDQTIEEVVSELELTEDEIMQLTTIFKEKNMKNQKVTTAGVHEGLDKAFENLMYYYDYLIEAKKEHTSFSCSIQQREDKGEKRTQTKKEEANTQIELKDVIPFSERAKILEEHNPILTGDVSIYNGKTQSSENAYKVFVYNNSLEKIGQKQEGNLYVCEPIEGNKSTRIFYTPKEKIQEYSEQGQDANITIVQKYLSMTPKEFEKAKGSVTVNHTDFDTYKDRLDFYIQGTKGNMVLFKRYLPRLHNLYSNPNITLPYYRARNIGEIGALGNGIVDRTAQTMIDKGNKEETKE